MIQKRQHVFGKLLCWVLEHQYVELDEDDLWIYHVIIGSGMGLECSGDVSDASFHELAEGSFILRSDVVSKYGIEFYARFRDDILLILSCDFDLCRECIDEFRRHSRFFKLKVETVSKRSVTMLDLHLFKGAGYQKNGRLDVGIYQKPTVQGAALSSHSFHVPSIHESWPSSRVFHYKSVCSSRALFIAACVALFRKIRTSDAWHIALPSIAHAIVHVRQLACRRKSMPRTPCIRIVLPYHPRFSRLNAKFSLMREAFGDSGLQEMVPQLAWSLAGPSILRRVQAEYRAKLCM